MIKTKKDCIEFLESRKAFYDYYDGKAFSYDSYSGTYGWNCKTRIFYDGNWYVFSWGQGWSDIQSTMKTYPELLEIIWKDRRFINAKLKERMEQNA